MRDLLKRVHVVLTALPTWLTLAAVVLTTLAGEISTAWPGAAGGETVVEWLIRVAAWLGAAVAIIRRVTPVTKELHGLLREG